MSKPEEHILKIGLGDLDVLYMDIAEFFYYAIKYGFDLGGYYPYSAGGMLDIKYLRYVF